MDLEIFCGDDIVGVIILVLLCLEIVMYAVDSV